MKLSTLRAGIAAGFAATTGRLKNRSKAAGNTPVSFDSDYGWRPMIGTRFGATYSGSSVDWAREAGPLWENPAIALCLGFLFDKMVEVRPEVLSAKDPKTDKRSPVPDAPLTALFEQPNPEYGWLPLMQATLLSVKLDGNAYIVKHRGSIGSVRGAGPPVELWYVPHWEMEPVAPEGGGPTQVFKRQVGNRVFFYPKEDVIHIRTGLNPRNMRKGWSNFGALLREVCTDGEIATFTATVIRNLGIVGALVSPKGDAEFEDDQDLLLKDKLRSQTTGDLRGDVVVSSIPIEVSRVGYSPQELAIGDMAERPEARLISGFRFNAMALGLPSDDKKYANLKESRQGAWEDGIIPGLTMIAAALTSDVLPEMGGKPGEIVAWDYTNVRDLLPDLVAEDKRSRDNFAGGVATLNEARQTARLPIDNTLDGYIWQLWPGKAAGTAGTAPATGADDDKDGNP